MKKVTLDCGLILTLTNHGEIGVIDNPTDLQENCIYCGQTDCYGDCEGSKNDTIGLEESDYVNDRRTFNAIIDSIQSMILAHACAGIDVASEQYQEGIKTALDAIQNNYGV
jgi:hypothetical protein